MHVALLKDLSFCLWDKALCILPDVEEILKFGRVPTHTRSDLNNMIGLSKHWTHITQNRFSAMFACNNLDCQQAACLTPICGLGGQ